MSRGSVKGQVADVDLLCQGGADHLQADQQEGPGPPLLLLADREAAQVSGPPQSRLQWAPRDIQGDRPDTRYQVNPLHTVTVCRVLAAKDYLVFGHDHIGHGESDGKRAYIENVDHYVDDIIHHSMELKVSSLLRTLDWLSGQEKYKELPIYIIGHSMGGMIALRSVLRHPGYFSGMILNGPLVIPGPQVTRRGRVGGLLILLSVDWSNWPEVHSNPYICIEDRVTASQLDHTRGPWRETKFKVAILNFLGPTGQTKPQSNHKVIPRHSESLKVWF